MYLSVSISHLRPPTLFREESAIVGDSGIFWMFSLRVHCVSAILHATAYLSFYKNATYDFGQYRFFAYQSESWSNLSFINPMLFYGAKGDTMGGVVYSTFNWTVKGGNYVTSLDGIYLGDIY